MSREQPDCDVYPCGAESIGYCEGCGWSLCPDHSGTTGFAKECFCQSPADFTRFEDDE